MDKHLTLALQIEEWTRQAVEQSGYDWKKVVAYIEARIAELDDTERAKIDAEARFTLYDHVGRDPDASPH